MEIKDLKISLIQRCYFEQYVFVAWTSSVKLLLMACKNTFFHYQ